MFPLADARGRVLGFGARAMRNNQGPKYLNSADGELYHKGRQLYGAHLARAHASRAGTVVVCEGYTDVLALHQAGLRNSVGLMGTAVTPEQVGELGRMASRIEMALDADSAGQQAMLRAAQVAHGRNLELRVVPLPPGTDPAELVQGEGAAGMRARLTRSVPFVRFRVEQAVAAGDLGTAEGRDRVLDELRPIFSTLGPSAMREELLRLVADRLELSPALLESLVGRREGRVGPESVSRSGAGENVGAGNGGLGSGAGARPGGGARPLERREQTERTFLALCLALPDRGRDALGRLRPEDRYFTGELTRRAAVHLRDHLESPAQGLPAADADLAQLIAELSVRAATEPAHLATLELEALQLELAAVDREIVAARASGQGDVGGLATRRARVKVEVDKAVDRAMAVAGVEGE
jgi:DNA primase